MPMLTHIPSPRLNPCSQSPFRTLHRRCGSLNSGWSTAAAQIADQILLVQLSRAHEDEHFVRQALAQAREQHPVLLVHKGVRTTNVLLLGRTRLILETPYLREDRQV